MINSSALIARMGKVAHFKSMTPANLLELIQAGRIKFVRAGTTLCQEYAECPGLFVLIKGKIHLAKIGPDGRETIMHVLNPVTMFNEVPVLDGGLNPATAVTAQDSIIWHCLPSRFQELLHKYPQLSLGMLPLLAARNRFLVSQYEDMSFRSVEARAAKLLLDLSKNGQHPIPRREHSIQQMAAQIATVPEAFSRALSHLKAESIIFCNRSTISVIELDQLFQHAQIELDIHPN
ncbi:MAG: Crp/Fnr family transcriptional regulator [Chloroflexi bacterium]|nr:Crp/Fnr family transcriptional regulator [Chloroflexota bacterium]